MSFSKNAKRGIPSVAEVFISPGQRPIPRSTGWKPIPRSTGWKPIPRSTGWKPIPRDRLEADPRSTGWKPIPRSTGWKPIPRRQAGSLSQDRQAGSLSHGASRKPIARSTGFPLPSSPSAQTCRRAVQHEMRAMFRRAKPEAGETCPRVGRTRRARDYLWSELP